MYLLNFAKQYQVDELALKLVFVWVQLMECWMGVYLVYQMVHEMEFLMDLMMDAVMVHVMVDLTELELD